MPVTKISDAADHQDLKDILNTMHDEFGALRNILGGALVGSVTADVASIAAGAEGSQAVTVTGAAVGDFVLASIVDATPTSGSLADAFLNPRVSAADTVTIYISNVHASTALDLSANAVFRVLVIPKGAAACPAKVLSK